MRTAFSRLGLALAPWLSRFGATALVVGGSISQSWDLVYPSLVAGTHASPCEVPNLMVFAANDSQGSARPCATAGCAWSRPRSD
jgi:hypothetical protein